MIHTCTNIQELRARPNNVCGSATPYGPQLETMLVR